MENFVLYEELEKSEFCITYKGRRKGTINFVAIHCVDKRKRPEVTNTVRVTHDINHPNIVRFYEWYETSNHLWVVVELCTGGSLSKVIQQDGNLPESAIRSFGVNLVQGLSHIHSLGIIFNDLQPSKILLDTTGTLKYADFGLAKVEGENLDELFQKFADAGDQWNPENMDEVFAAIKTSGSLTYMTPEVIGGAESTVLSDLWSLGCVLYEMFAGHPPFLAESEVQLKEKILRKDFPQPRIKGSRLSAKASPDFLNLLEGLLQKDPAHRLGWPGLVVHPFWQGELLALAKNIEITGELQTSIVSTVCSSLLEHGGGSSLGRIKVMETQRSIERPISRLDTVDAFRPGSTMSELLRPKTAPGLESCGSLFTLSARPGTAVPPDDKITAAGKTVRSPFTTREDITAAKQLTTEALDEDSVKPRPSTDKFKLIYHASDFTVTSIIDNPKIQKPAPVKYDPKILPAAPFSVEKLLSLSDADMEKHLRQVLEGIITVEKGPPTQRRLQLLNYAVTIVTSPTIADHLLSASALVLMGKQIKETAHSEVRVKLARVMALIAHHATTLDSSTQITEPLTILTEVVREGVKNSKMKQGLFPAVGEIWYLVAFQEQKQGHSSENWTVPPMAYTVVAKYCRDMDDPVLSHIAAKIVENVTTTQGSHSQKFVNNDMARSLWYLFKHSTIDAVRWSAISALCHLTWQNASVFQSVIDTVGLSTVLGALSIGISRIQQAVITMFGALVQSGSHLTRLLQDKDFLQRNMRLLESPSSVIRGKAFCVLHFIFQNSLDMLLSCHTRLVMYIERDSRRQPTLDNQESKDGEEYLSQCLDVLISFICQAVPNICRELLAALEAAPGRKHSSTLQLRQLKTLLPLLTILPHLVTSQVFRNRVVTEGFVCDLGELLTHVKDVEAGSLSKESMAAISSVPDFVRAVLAILEGISQHPPLLLQFQENIISIVLPTLISLLASPSVETKAHTLQLLSEIAYVYFSQNQFNQSEKFINISQLQSIITVNLLPQFEQVLLDPEPLPSSGLKLLLALLDQNPAFIKQLEEVGLVPVVFQALLDHQNNPLSSAMQSIVGILNSLISHKETHMHELYDQGLVEYLATLFYEVSAVCFEGEEGGRDIKAANVMLQSLLDTLHSILKYVSDVIRKAIQTKKAVNAISKEAEEAENLLVMNKSLTDLTSILTQLLCYDDTDIQDLAIKCLSLLVQLYGGENREALSPENMGYYSKALHRPDTKKQKVLLRIIKRLISTEKHHRKALRDEGADLVRTIKGLVQMASSHADGALSSVAAEVLNILENSK